MIYIQVFLFLALVIRSFLNNRAFLKCSENLIVNSTERVLNSQQEVDKNTLKELLLSSEIN